MDYSWTNPPNPAKQSSIYTLLSPPKDKRQDSFDSTSDKMSGITPNTSFTADNASQTPPSALNGTPKAQLGVSMASPLAGLPSPVSPEFRDIKEKVTADEVDGPQDPQLFQGSDNGDAALPVDVPLFPRQTQPDQLQMERNLAISQHMARTTSERSTVSTTTTTSTAPRPTRDEYDLFASMVQKWSQPMRMSVMPYIRADPVAAVQRAREELREITRAAHRPTPKRSPAKANSRPILNGPSFKMKKPAAPLKPRPARAPKQPFERAFFIESYGTLKPAPSPKMKTPRPSGNLDVNYNVIPDYSPPAASTLDGLARTDPGKKPLKIIWKGSPINLDNDPDRHLLHEQEVAAASALRLTCAQYLTSKRRIFQAKVEKLRQGKEFRKTDAQQACHIDVNKASYLWTAFDKAGWFQRKYFEKYL